MEASVVDPPPLRPTTVIVKQPRNSHSCPACRNDRKRCTFFGKPWDEGKHVLPCDRCKNKKRQCNTPTHIPRTPKALVNQSHRAEGQVTPKEAENEDEKTQTQAEQNKLPDQLTGLPAHSTRRTLDAWGLASYTSLDNLFKLLGNVSAARELVYSAQFICEDVKQWRSGNYGDTYHVEAKLSRLVADLDKFFESTWNSAFSLSVAALANDSWRADLVSFWYRFKHPRERATSSVLNNDTMEHFKQLIDEQFTRNQKTGYYSPADQVHMSDAILLSCQDFSSVTPHDRYIINSSLGADGMPKVLKRRQYM